MLSPKKEHIKVITSLMKHDTKKEKIIFESVSRFIRTKTLALTVYELRMKLVSKNFSNHTSSFFNQDWYDFFETKL